MSNKKIYQKPVIIVEDLEIDARLMAGSEPPETPEFNTDGVKDHGFYGRAKGTDWGFDPWYDSPEEQMD